MAQLSTDQAAILDIFWQSLEGTDYDLEAMKARLRPDSGFEDLGLDSLDVTDFFLRLEDRYQIKIRQEEYGELDSLAAIESYLKQRVVAA